LNSAARGGLAGKTYTWGDEFSSRRQMDGKYLAGKFRLKTRAKDGYAVSLRSRNFRRMATVFTTWPATFGNGAAIGIVLIIMSNSRKPVGVAINPRGPDSPFDPSEPKREKAGASAAAHFFATTNIARATCRHARQRRSQYRHHNLWFSLPHDVGQASAPKKSQHRETELNHMKTC